MNLPAIAIHGGAGPATAFIKAREEQYLRRLGAIVQEAYNALKEGAGALDAVTQAVCMLEDDPLFNAGKGSALNRDGKTGMDAAIMDGNTQKAGAVAHQTRVPNPIKLARAVMDGSPYVLLTGSALEELIKEKKLETVPESYFHVAHQLQVYEERRQKEQGAASGNSGQDHGTVGAVARDQYGNVAAGTSTGGADFCIPGRISDSCIIGAGCYAHNESCAVSGTGDGEFLITGVVAHKIAALVALAHYSVADACRAVISEYPAGKCDMGVIAIDRKGRIGHAFNTDRMHRAWIDMEGRMTCHIYKT
jgi:L-asparaginase / beta-aspartyl-peptidase